MKKTKAFIVVLLSLMIFQCSGDKDKNLEKDTFTIGVVNAVDKKKYKRVYPKIAKYLATKLGIKKYKTVILDYKEIADSLYENKIDLAVFSPYSYIEAKNKYNEFDLFAVSITEDELKNLNDGYHSVIAVKFDSDIYKIKDLNDKKLIFTHSKSTSGFVIPSSFFKEENNRDIHFIDMGFSGGHKNSVMLLKNDSVDAITTYKEVFYELQSDSINPENYRFIYISEKIPNNAYVLAPSLSKNFKDKVKKVIYNSINDYKRLKEHGVVTPEDSLAAFFLDNDFKIRYWAKKRDNFYDNLRKRIALKNAKSKIKLKVVADEIIKRKYENIESSLSDKITKKLMATNRFYNPEDTTSVFNNIIHNIEVILGEYDDISISYDIFIKKKKLKRDFYEIDQLDSTYVNHVFKQIMQHFNLKIDRKHIFYDKKQEEWIIKYGLNHGIDINHYQFIIVTEDNEHITLQKDKFSNDCMQNKDLIKLPNYYENEYKKAKYLKIVYKG